MKPTNDLSQELDHIAEHVEAVKQLLLAAQGKPKRSPKQAMQAFDALATEISAAWVGPDAITEIRQQREKGD